MSQITGPGAGGFANDCGPASLAMFIHGKGKFPSVADIYHATGVERDQYINGGQLVRAAANWGIALRSMYWDMDKMRQSIDTGKPLIALVHYGTFSKLGRTESSFRGPHFFSVVGYKDGKIVVHDPLWSGEGGKYLEWTDHVFHTAWDDARHDGGNPAFWGLRCEAQFDALDDETGAEPPDMPDKPEVWGTGIVIAQALYLRHHPGGRVITALRQGTTVDVLGPKENGWYHVRWEGVEGWCGGNPRYIRVNQAPPTPPTPPDPDPGTKKFMELPESERWKIVRDHLVDQGIVSRDGYILD